TIYSGRIDDWEHPIPELFLRATWIIGGELIPDVPDADCHPATVPGAVEAQFCFTENSSRNWGESWNQWALTVVTEEGIGELNAFEHGQSGTVELIFGSLTITADSGTGDPRLLFGVALIALGILVIVLIARLVRRKTADVVQVTPSTLNANQPLLPQARPESSNVKSAKTRNRTLTETEYWDLYVDESDLMLFDPGRTFGRSEAANHRTWGGRDDSSERNHLGSSGGSSGNGLEDYQDYDYEDHDG
ncbi:MAG: hypothetical protein FWG25_08775, partial [Promicromonosporaceae bacterium]|nr:hypothetical protein [Promicromonosporaceae bacterium]